MAWDWSGFIQQPIPRYPELFEALEQYAAEPIEEFRHHP
jgi:hypothetical protein